MMDRRINDNSGPLKMDKKVSSRYKAYMTRWHREKISWHTQFWSLSLPSPGQLAALAGCPVSLSATSPAQAILGSASLTALAVATSMSNFDMLPTYARFPASTVRASLAANSAIIAELLSNFW